MEHEEDSDDLSAALPQILPLLYGFIFYQASVKLAPRVVVFVAKYFGLELDAEFK